MAYEKQQLASQPTQPTWDDETASREAKLSLLTGKNPTFGRGKEGEANRTAFYKARNEAAKEIGDTPEGQALKQAAYKANSTELNKLQAQRGPIMAFESTARKSLDLAEKLSQKVDRFGVPVIDRWIQAGKKSVVGDPDVAAFHAQVELAANEFAKLTSSTTGAGATSDSAREHANHLLDPSFTKVQFKAVADAMRQDMDYRKQGFEEQIQNVKDNISHVETKASETGLPVVKTGDKKAYDKVKPGEEYLDGNGVKHTKKKK
jgi:hypothetical protein